MKIVMEALNAKYIHMSLAPWYLKVNCNNKYIIRINEHTVNMETQNILDCLFRQQPNIVAFSCYIFNMEMVERLAGDLKKILPRCVVILGGPEVSFDPRQRLESLPAADYIISGAGERAFPALLDYIAAGSEGRPCPIPGVSLRAGGRVQVNPPAPEPPDLGEIASPYTEEMLRAANGKILYFESSRGCPFHCSYCLSSVSAGVQYLPMDMVKQRLTRLLESDVHQIKFVDRTFNCNRDRAKEIFRFLLEAARADASGKIAAKNIHFEMAADLFDDEMLQILSRAPEGFFQVEIGIQSFNGKTLEAVRRKTDLALCARVIKQLWAPGNIHIHLDLIAGLPEEDIRSFAVSFNRVHALRPHALQLGFLKLLKGSEMRKVADSGGYAYSSRPPYEILRTPSMGYAELSFLHRVAHIVDRLYNSGKFCLSERFACSLFSSPYELYAQLAAFLDGSGFFEKNRSLKEFCGLLCRFIRLHAGDEEYGVFNELLKYDWFSSDNSGCPPACLRRAEEPRLRELYRQLLRKDVAKPFHLEVFDFDVPAYEKTGLRQGPALYCFRYSQANRVTGLYRSFPLALPSPADSASE